MTGTLYGIGVGPGDPELVTRKAWAQVQRATHLVYPVPAHLDTSRARTTVAQAIAPDCTELPYHLPMASARQPAQAVYDTICADIAPLLAQGHDVSVLCEGDPSLYGSFLYIRARLKEYACCVTPGISSILAGAAQTHFALAVRQERFGVLSATLDQDTLRQSLETLDSVTFLKAGRHMAKLKAVLHDWYGVYAQNISHDTQKTCPLAEAPDEAPYFSLVFARKSYDEWI